MNFQQQLWAVVLAAGDGTRLAALTTDARGNPVPKQFCSLRGQGSLLEDALQRAGHVVRGEQVCVVVAEQHRRYWQRALRALPPENVIVQPRNCGTANGVLLATLHVLERDPRSRIMFLPADHFVRDEPVLARSLRELAALPDLHPRELVLLGIEPEEADPELGYIVPGACLAPHTHCVAHFAEKPPCDAARELLKGGALWNSFIFAAQGPTLVQLLRARMPESVAAMAAALAIGAGEPQPGRMLRELYQRLPNVDFSRDIVAGAEQRLRVLRSPACGWSDLGTPKRVAATLQQPVPAPIRSRRPAPYDPPLLNLALQFAHWSSR
ncbi:MAG TPA: sugar phosphate nucleotidyltransferase [Steroidobacteraceae bacterium]